MYNWYKTEGMLSKWVLFAHFSEVFATFVTLNIEWMACNVALTCVFFKYCTKLLAAKGGLNQIPMVMDRYVKSRF